MSTPIKIRTQKHAYKDTVREAGRQTDKQKDGRVERQTSDTSLGYTTGDGSNFLWITIEWKRRGSDGGYSQQANKK